MKSMEPVLDSTVLSALSELPSSDPRGMLPMVIDLFRKHAPPLLQTINAAVGEGELETARLQAHAFKSAAGTVGAAQLRTLLAELETAARVGDREGVRTTLLEVRHLTEVTLEALDAELAALGSHAN